MVKNKQPYALDPNTKLKLIAIHKETFEEFIKEITFYEYQTLNKNKNYYYKAVQLK
jgi:hypothetical protein